MICEVGLHILELEEEINRFLARENVWKLDFVI